MIIAVSTVWGDFSKGLQDKLQKPQNTAGRIVTKPDFSTRAHDTNGRTALALKYTMVKGLTAFLIFCRFLERYNQNFYDISH